MVAILRLGFILSADETNWNRYRDRHRIRILIPITIPIAIEL